MTTPLKHVVHRPPPPEDKEAPAFRTDRNLALYVIAGCAAMAVLYWARAVFIPIVLSILISYALSPIVRSLTRIRVPRLLASAAVVALLTGGLGYTGDSLAAAAPAIVAAIPDAATRRRRVVRREQGEDSPIQQVQRAAEELQRTAD